MQEFMGGQIYAHDVQNSETVEFYPPKSQRDEDIRDGAVQDGDKGIWMGKVVDLIPIHGPRWSC